MKILILSYRDNGGGAEIAQDAALYFEPKNKTQLKNILEKLLLEDSLRKKLIQKNKSCFIEFSREKTADQTVLENYRRIWYNSNLIFPKVFTSSYTRRVS
ncbi:MAG: hypothetical protein ACI4LX_05555 [Treponema sp.]